MNKVFKASLLMARILGFGPQQVSAKGHHPKVDHRWYFGAALNYNLPTGQLYYPPTFNPVLRSPSTTVGYAYLQHCFLDKVTYGQVTLYDAISANGQGQITSYALGDGNTTQITYTDGRPTRYYANGVQDLNMAYDPATGNLNYRWNKMVQRKESFAYDALDRLIAATVNEVDAAGTPTALVGHYTYMYDGAVGSSTAGDLIQRTDIGKFNYAQGHAPTDAFGDTPGASAPAAISQATQSITYTSFLKAATIAETVGSDAYQLTYTYGTDHQRAKSELKKNGNTLETRFYVGAYEEQRLPGTTNKIHYVNGPGGLCAMIVQANGAETIYYVYKDHLGSPVTLTKGQLGGLFAIEARQNFDAWGRRRNPTDWSYVDVPAPPAWLYRGYTGHEHVEPFALVNMNGRMYDPLNGRMLSADNYVQGGLGTQGYNRYSYAGNNPMKYTDPDGEFVQYIIGGIIGGIQGYMIGQNAGLKGGKLWASTLAGAAIGALSAGVATSISASSGAVVGSMAGGAISGSGMNLISGVANGQNAGSVAGGMLAGGFLGGMNGLISGGIGSGIGGGAGAFTGGASAGALSALIGGQDGGGILKSAVVGGASSLGLYHLSGALNYRAYKRSGLVFGESRRQLSYRQFIGMGADFGRSRFWNREHGGMLLEDGSIYRGAVDARGPDFISWDPSDTPANIWGSYHTHWAKAGDPAPGGGVYIDYHSTLDFDGHLSTHFPSLVITRGDVVYKPAYNGPYDTGILQHFQFGIQRYLTYPFFSLP